MQDFNDFELTRRDLLKAGAVTALVSATPLVARGQAPAAEAPVMAKVSLNVNGKAYNLKLDSRTSLLDTLEKRGLIERLRHPDDRRKLLVQITPAAQEIVDALLPSLHARERAVMSDALTVSEQRQLLKLIAKVQQAAIHARSEPAVHDARRVRPNPPD